MSCLHETLGTSFYFNRAQPENEMQRSGIELHGLYILHELHGLYESMSYLTFGDYIVFRFIALASLVPVRYNQCMSRNVNNRSNRYAKERRAEREKIRMMEKRRRKNKALLFLSVFLCVLGIGGIILSMVYMIKMHGVTSGLSQLATDSEHVLEQAFPFGLPRSDKSQAQENESVNETHGKYADLLADPDKMKAENAYAKETANPGEVTMTFTGDVMFDDSYSIMSTYKGAGNDVSGCMSEDLLAKMRESDILMLNNECTFTTRGTPTEGKTYTFRGKPENVKILQDIGADIVSLANNHAYDYGEISLLDTMDTLKGAEIPYVGAGKNIEEAEKPVYFIAGDIKIAVLSATQIERVDNPDTKGATESAPGVFRCRDPKALCEAITKAKENSDYVVVYVHWGTENETTIDWAQRDQAPMYAEAGADLIIGDHPHCLQGITYINDTPVIYSLGNFWFNSKTIDTGMVQVTFDANGIKNFQFIPCLQANCRTTLLGGGEKERVLQKMRELSLEVSIDADGYVTR